MDTSTRQNPAAVYLVVDKYIDQEGDVPEFLKSASSPTYEELADLSDVAFADGGTRRYPINSLNNAALSVIEYRAYGDADRKTEGRIKKACSNYNIVDFYNTVENIFLDEQTKSASETFVKYAFVMVDEGGQERGYYPLNTPFEIEQSAVSFASSVENVPVDLAASIAEEIIKAASAKGVDMTTIPEAVQILGEPRMLDESWAQTQVRLRNQFVPDYIAEAYDDIVKSASEGGEIGELVALMDNLDQEFIPEDVKNHNILYRNAFCTLNSGETVKNADAIAENYVFMHEEDILLPAQALASVSPGQIEAIFTKNTAEQVLEVVKSASDDAFTATALINGLPGDIRKEIIKLTLNTNVA